MNALAPSRPSPETWAHRLLRDGYCIIPDVLSSSVVTGLEADLDPAFAATPLCQGRFYGERTRRSCSLLKHSPHMSAMVMNAIIIDIIETVSENACDRIQLVAQAIEIHPGEARQVPHRDHDMWQGAKGAHEYLVNVNVMWPLTPFIDEMARA
ncbi:Phytanoyl-CoA dioxygenase [Novosphingobium resinovorum]|uniref:Phytanoyl-CoA dioxygenase n=1 Tax=Novosphingobium resinovorum TaxID=158500 RepID=A0A031K1F2_9SPHN|nr:phytanoyl-CoA dioxygenase family protein [Novosphingobium resinovorum]EZP82432.1 Phytanoyl-CoA dioxygenase [Novosphingobium resinovorum]